MTRLVVMSSCRGEWCFELCFQLEVSYPSFQSSHVLKQYGLVSSPWYLFYSHETLIFSSILWYINISAKFCSLFNTTHKSLMTPPLRMTLLEEPLCCVRIYSIKLPTLSRWCLPREPPCNSRWLFIGWTGTNWNLNASCMHASTFESNNARRIHDQTRASTAASIVSIILY